MVRRAVAATLSALALLPGAAAAAQAPPRIFTIAGTGQPGNPRAGAVASAVPAGPFRAPAVTALPDGGLAFATFDDVWALRPSGRLVRLVGAGSLGIPEDIVAGPDGSVYVAFDRSIRRITSAGIATLVVRPLAGAGEITAVDRADDGSLLFAAGRAVWRVGPAGRLTLVAGREDVIGAGPVAEGGPAVGVGFLALSPLAALPGGGFVFNEARRRVWRVAPDGTIRTFLGRRAAGLQPLRDGSLLFSAPTHLRRAADGRTTVVAGSGKIVSAGDTALTAGHAQRLTSFDGDAGDRRLAPIAPGSVAVTRDGGIVFADRARIRYLPPARPELLAVGIARPTISTRRRIRVTVATTLPASVTATVVHNGQTIQRVRGRTQEGRAVIRMPRRVAGGEYQVHVFATSATGQLAADAITLIVGRALPLALVRRVVRAEVVASDREDLGVGPDASRIEPCRHFGRARVDCGDFGDAGFVDDRVFNACRAVHTFILRRSGVVARGDYGVASADPDGCKLRSRPHFVHRPRPFELPLPDAQ